MLIVIFVILCIILLLIYIIMSAIMRKITITGGSIAYNLTKKQIFLEIPTPPKLNVKFLEFCKTNTVEHIREKFPQYKVNSENLKSYHDMIAPILYGKLPKTATATNVDEVMELSKKYKINPITIINELKLGEKMKHDPALGIYNLDHQHEIRLNSKKFEKLVEEKLIKLNIDYKTEEELVGTGLTPDFLLIDSNLYVGENKINWIDAKNYSWFDGKMTHKKLIVQAEKYTKAFGMGLFVFNGIWSDTPIKNSLISDISDL